jgi:hypothetical protein
MHGWLHGKSRDAALPTIAVVASYDTFATSPVCLCLFMHFDMTGF